MVVCLAKPSSILERAVENRSPNAVVGIRRKLAGPLRVEIARCFSQADLTVTDEIFEIDVWRQFAMNLPSQRAYQALAICDQLFGGFQRS